jgi:hypothetical protein
MTNPDLIAKTILLLKKLNDAEGGHDWFISKECIKMLF